MKIAIEVREIVVTELRRRYDKICMDYDHTRIKILTLLGGGLIYLSYLYAPKQDVSTSSSIFFPSNLGSQIFYVIGIVLFIGALSVLFWAIRPGLWSLPITMKEIDSLMKNHPKKEAFLDYLKNEYIDAINFCQSSLYKKVTLLNIAINMLFIGAIILTVLKYFEG